MATWSMILTHWNALRKSMDALRTCNPSKQVTFFSKKMLTDRYTDNVKKIRNKKISCLFPIIGKLWMGAQNLTFPVDCPQPE